MFDCHVRLDWWVSNEERGRKEERRKGRKRNKRGAGGAKGFLPSHRVSGVLLLSKGRFQILCLLLFALSLVIGSCLVRKNLESQCDQIFFLIYKTLSAN